jgi:16S rRNA (uracil1498-N3)-methyltransferase
MQPHLFYAPTENYLNDKIILPDSESHHARKVLRLSKGELVIVIDGLGKACRGEIITGQYSKKTEIAIHHEIRNFGEPNIRLTLAAGLSTNYKFDTVVEKGTELGVKRFVPLLTEKSKVKMDDGKRIKSRITRLEKVALAATKQCRRSYRPDISAPVNFKAFMKETDPEGLNLIFHPGNEGTLFQNLEIINDYKRACLLVGSESGFSNTEVLMAHEAGFQQISIGSRILRTETAGPVVCALLMNAFGELS